MQRSYDHFVDRFLTVRSKLKPTASPYDGWPEGFPCSDAIREVLNAAFYASLETYEGAGIQTTLRWTHPVHGITYVHEFTDPVRDLSPNTLRQLAQTADGKTTVLELVIDQADRLSIGGVGFLWHPQSALENAGLVAGIRITIKGPGHIEYQEGFIAVAYMKGRSVRLRPLQEITYVDAWLQESEKALVELAKKQLKNDHVWGKTTTEPDFPKNMMLSFVFEMLRAIEFGGHGGTLLVLPDEDRAGHIDLRFPASENSLSRFVKDFGSSSIFIKKHDYPAVSPLAPAHVDTGNLMVRLRQFGAACGRLASCDGAVVMTRDAKLLGFGGIIESPSEERPQPVLKRGARHTSAQRELKSFATVLFSPLDCSLQRR